MPYEPFYEIFPELAWKETRSITIAKNHPILPADEFVFLELYCNDENCDCQRVIFDVLSRKRSQMVAVITYGWESLDFYRKWSRSGDPAIYQDMYGLGLNSMSDQSELAPALLNLAQDVLLKDPAYLARLKRHYQIFKEKVDPKHFHPSTMQKQPAPVGLPASKKSSSRRHNRSHKTGN